MATEAEDNKKASEDAPVASDTAADKKTRRRLKPAPTIREQSEQATARANRPKRSGITGKIVTILTAPFRLIGWILRNTIGRVFRFLGKYKFFRAIGYVFVPPYFRTAWKELRLVTWPDFRQTRDLTVAVIIFSVIFAAIVGALDYGLDKVFRAIIH